MDTSRTSLRHNAARSLVWTLLESFGLSGVSLLALIAFARLLSPVDMGVGAIALGIVQLLIVPVEILFQDALIQRASVEDAHFDTAFTATLALCIALFSAAWSCAGPVARLVGIAEVAPVLQGMSLSLIPMAFGSIIAARQRRELAFRPLAVRSLIGRAGGAAVGIAFAFHGGGVWALVVQQVLLVTFAAATLWLMSGQRPRLRFSARHFHDLIGFGLRSTLVMSANVAAPRVYMLLVGTLLGAASAGYMNIAFRAVDMLRDVVAGAVSQLALPLFGRSKEIRGGLQHGYVEATSFTCLVGFPMFMGLSVCAPEVVTLLFGPQWAPSVSYVAFLGLLVMPYFARLYVMSCMAAAGSPQAALPGLAVILGIVAVGMLLVGRLSLAAAAAVWAVRLLAGIPVDAVMLRRVSAVGYRAQMQGIGFPLLASAGMAAAVTAARVLLLQDLPSTTRIVAMVPLGIVVYGGLMLILDRATVMRVLSFAGATIRPPERQVRDAVGTP